MNFKLVAGLSLKAVRCKFILMKKSALKISFQSSFQKSEFLLILYTVTVNSTGHTANLSNGILSKICLTPESFRSWISCFYLNFSSSSESDSSWVTQLVSFELLFEPLRILTISLNFRTTPIHNSVYVTLWGDSRT